MESRSINFRLALIIVAGLLLVTVASAVILVVEAAGTDEAVSGPAQADASPTPTEAVYTDAELGMDPQRYTVEILEVLPHDPTAYTQGLLLYDGKFYESTGLHDPSTTTLREVDPETGAVLRRYDWEDRFFGEGLALVDEERLVQLSWKAETAFVYDRETFELLETWTFAGRGWGLCYDGAYLYRSDGTEYVYIHDPETFAEEDFFTVTLYGAPITQLNELECVGDYIYANVWHQDIILQIDKATGVTVGIIDAPDLLTAEEFDVIDDAQAVLNGIAYDPEEEVFYLTGKLWPKLFKVEFVPVPAGDDVTPTPDE